MIKTPCTTCPNFVLTQKPKASKALIFTGRVSVVIFLSTHLFFDSYVPPIKAQHQTEGRGDLKQSAGFLLIGKNTKGAHRPFRMPLRKLLNNVPTTKKTDFFLTCLEAAGPTLAGRPSHWTPARPVLETLPCKKNIF